MISKQIIAWFLFAASRHSSSGLKVPEPYAGKLARTVLRERKLPGANIKMKKTLSIIILLFSLNLTAQEIHELEADLSQTVITDLKEITKKADKIFETDPFNEVAIYYLTESYRYTSNDSLVPQFFEEKISENPKIPSPYLLSAKYQFRDFSFSDTTRLKPLKKAIALDPNNFEANYLLGVSYYQLFNEKISSDSLLSPKFFASQSRDFLRTSIKIDSSTFSYLKYPIIQLSSFLKDDATAIKFGKLELNPSTDDNGIPKDGQFYFPVSRFVELDDNWKTSYSTDILRETNMTTFVLDWYSGQLLALKEPLIFDRENETIYRFTWLRTFHHPVAIRIQKNKDQIQLTWKMSDGAGGYSPGKLITDETTELTTSEWNEFLKLLDKTEYWNMSTNEQSDIMGTDGSRWIIEGVQNGKYNVVDRWTPRNSAYQELGMFLINLTDLDIPKKDIY